MSLDSRLSALGLGLRLDERDRAQRHVTGINVRRRCNPVLIVEATSLLPLPIGTQDNLSPRIILLVIVGLMR
eukprot:scaffold33625_cov160-Skeletonema_dohrnii-CCMP3373.AAC.1